MPKRNRVASLTVDVSVPHDRRAARGFEGTPEALHEGDRPMAPAGAAQGYGQVRFALALVQGEEEAEQVFDLGEQRAAVLERHHEFVHGRIAAVEALQTVHEMGIREKAHVEHEVGVVRRAVLEAEGHERDLERVPSPLGAVGLDEPLLELMHGQPGGVDDAIRALAQVAEGPSLGADAFEDAPLAGQGVTAPRLLIAPHQGLVRRFQEEHLRLVPLPAQFGERLQQMGEIAALPDVDAERDHSDVAARVDAQLGEGRDEGGGQVVDAEVTEVLETLDGEAAPGARHAGDDHEPERRRASLRLCVERAHRFLGASRRWWEGMIPSSSRYLATVRRAMVRPCPRRTSATSWSD